MRNPYFKWILILIVTYLWFSLTVYFTSDWLLFNPYAKPTYKESMSGLFYIPVGESDTMTVYTIPNPNAEQVLIYFHGNGEDIGSNLKTMDIMKFMGYEPYLIDYGGYGYSNGKPSVPRFYQDAEAIYRYLTNVKKIPPEKIIVHGRSLGGAAAIYLASRYPVGGLVAESTFLSVFRVITQFPLLPLDKMRSYRLMPHVKCPILFIHGKKDGLIPFYHAETLFDLAPEPKFYFWAAESGHNNVESKYSESFWKVIHEFKLFCLNNTQKNN